MTDRGLSTPEDVALQRGPIPRSGIRRLASMNSDVATTLLAMSPEDQVAFARTITGVGTRGELGSGGSGEVAPTPIRQDNFYQQETVVFDATFPEPQRGPQSLVRRFSPETAGPRNGATN